MRIVYVLFSAVVLSACQTPRLTQVLPVKKVVLYQNGVGYMERHGMLNGDQVKLQVRPDQINDVLTSLTVIDRSGGRAVSVSLPIEKEAAQRLADLPEQVRREGGLRTLLAAFRGARVEVQTDRDEIPSAVSGRVVGLEGERVAVLDEGGAVHHIRVEGIRSVKLQDRALEVGLRKALDGSLEEGSWKPVEVTVRLDRAGSHDLMVAYVVGLPTWKPAYRLVLGKEQEKPLLQGWAVVDNVSGEDWNDVALSLTSGSPISFKYDLHTPHFVHRPTVAPVHGEAAAPVAEAAVAAAPKRSRRRPEKRMKSRGKSGLRSAARPESLSIGSMGGAFGEVAEEKDTEEPWGLGDVAAAMGASATGQALNGLFHYDLPAPVTVPDRSSTLVNLINRRIDGEDLLLFRPAAGGAATKHPYRTVRFVNDTGFVLSGGPVTIFSAGSFAGEGIFRRIEDGAQTYLPYSLERGISVQHASSHANKPVRLLTVVDGVLTYESQNRHTHTYTVHSRLQDEHTLFVEVAKRSGWTLENMPEGSRELEGVYYLPIKLKGAQEKLVFTEVQPVSRRLALDGNASYDLLVALFDGGEVPAALKTALAKARAMAQKVAEARTSLKDKRRIHRQLRGEANRMARHVERLGKARTNAALRRELSGRLAGYERKVAGINGDIVRLEERIADLNKRLRAVLRGVSLKERQTKP
jgi:hypothetical protein